MAGASMNITTGTTASESVTERGAMIGAAAAWEIGGDQKRGTLRHAGAAGDSFKLVYGDGPGDYAVLTVDQARAAVAAAIVAAGEEADQVEATAGAESEAVCPRAVSARPPTPGQ